MLQEGRKVAGSTLDGVTDFSFSAPNPFGRTIASGSTQPVTEMSTGRFLEVKRSQRVSLTT
jgi:hypothetical protein